MDKKPGMEKLPIPHSQNFNFIQLKFSAPFPVNRNDKTAAPALLHIKAFQKVVVQMEEELASPCSKAQAATT